MGAEIDDRLNCRIPCHSFTCHSIRIASIVLSLVLESLRGGPKWQGILKLLHTTYT